MQIVFIAPIPRFEISITEPAYSDGGGNEGVELASNRVPAVHIIGTKSYQYAFLDGKGHNELIIEADRVFLNDDNELVASFSYEKQVDIDRLRKYVAEHPDYKEEIRYSEYYKYLQKKAKKAKPEPREIDAWDAYSDFDRKLAGRMRDR